MLQRLLSTRTLISRAASSVFTRGAVSVSTLGADPSEPNPISFAPPLLQQHLRDVPDTMPFNEFTPVFEAIAAANFERVVGVHPLRIVQHFNEEAYQFAIHNDHEELRLEGWGNVSTGKDLFSNGVGKFNIPAAINAAHARRQQMQKSNFDGEWPDFDDDIELRDRLKRLFSYMYWLVSPFTVQAHGVFPKLLHSSVHKHDYRNRLLNLNRLLRAPADSPPRRHLLRHRDWWDSDEKANMLDELTENNFYWPAETEDMKPPQLLNMLREMTMLRQVLLTSLKHFTYVSLHTNT